MIDVEKWELTYLKASVRLQLMEMELINGKTVPGETGGDVPPVGVEAGPPTPVTPET
jgi:hypothetical protein